MKNKKFLIPIFGFICAKLCGCATSYKYDNAKMYTSGAAIINGMVEHIDIDWIAGKVFVKQTDSNNLYFEEKANKTLTEATTVHYWLDGQNLKIKFGKAGKINFSNLNKELIVYVPESFSLTNLEMETVSADIQIEKIKGTNLDIETVSGDVKTTNVEFTNNINIENVSGNIKLITETSFNKLELENTSGNIEIDAKSNINSLEAEAVSGNIKINVNNIENSDIENTSGNIELSAKNFNSLEIDNISGDVTLFVPQQLEFGLKIETLGDFDYNIALIKDGKIYRTNQGVLKGEINTKSGNIKILSKN